MRLRAAPPLFLAVLMLAATGASPPARRAAVVASGQLPFQQASRAALDALGDEAAAHDAIAVRTDGARLSESDVVVSIGPLAGGSVARAVSSDARIVAVLTPRLMGLPPDRTLLVPLDPSPDDVVDVTRRLLPKAKRLGVLVGKSGPSATELVDIGRRYGLAVMPSHGDEGLATALDRLLPNIDVLWIDRSHPAVKDPDSMRLTLARCADANRPVVGASKNHVLGGALFALVPDPAGHGSLAGDLARRLLRGENIRLVPTPPGTVVLNERLARAHGVTAPSDLKPRLEAVR